MKEKDLQEWTLDTDTGILTINSTAAMTSAPWYPCRSAVKEVIITAEITSIANSAFEDYDSLVSITVPESVTSIGDAAFAGCRSLVSIALPEGLTSIDCSAFSGCSSLTAVTLPQSVNFIGYAAFNDCVRLTNITALNPVPISPCLAFYSVDKIASTLRVPASSVHLYQVAEEWSGFSQIIGGGKAPAPAPAP